MKSFLYGNHLESDRRRDAATLRPLKVLRPRQPYRQVYSEPF